MRIQNSRRRAAPSNASMPPAVGSRGGARRPGHRWAFALAVAVFALVALAAPPARAGARVGDPAPDFTAENLQDTAPDFFQLSNYRGSIVVIEFFAYW